MAIPQNATFSTFIDGGDLEHDDIVVGLRNGLNTRFSFKGDPGIYLPLSGGTMSGAIDMANNTITGLPAPIASTDAVNKAYADALVGGEQLSAVNDANVTLTLGGTPLTSLLRAVSLTLGWTGELSVMRGGTGAASFTAYSVICGGTSSTSPLQSVASVGTAGQVFTSNGAGALPSFQNNAASGTVNSGTQNQIAWYAATGTAVSGLPTGNNGVLITSSGGVPSISSTLPPGIAASGMILTSPLINQLMDTNGNLMLMLNGQALSVNNLAMSNAPTGNAPEIAATGMDTNVGFSLRTKGSGKFFLISEALTNPISINSGTLSQHVTNLIFSNTSAIRNVTFQDASGTLAFLTDIPSFPLALSLGGTNANLTASNGGIFYSTASAGAILAGTATAGLALLSGASSAPSWSSSPPITRIGIQSFTTAGTFTYTPTSGTKYVVMRSVGGGGGGAGVVISGVGGAAAGGGGGAGGYAEDTLPIATVIGAGTTAQVVIGAAGTGGNAGANNGGAGGNTVVTANGGAGSIVLQANGGTGGATGASLSVVAAQVGAPGVSGAGTVGSVLAAGTPASFGFIYGTSVQGIGGVGGSSRFGAAAVASVSVAGSVGTGFGCGGNGGGSANSAAAAGAAGKQGALYIYEFISI